MINEKRILVIAGPTCSGESTITKAIIKKYPVFKRLVTATSRKPRLSEKNKVDYYFFSDKEFKEKIKKGEILEYTYFPATKTYYGTYKKDLETKLSQGYNIIINPDIVGAKYFKNNYNATTIFLHPGSLEIIKLRLKKRDPSMSDLQIKNRLKTAKKELEKDQKKYDYIVKNEQNKLNVAINRVIEIINNENYRLK